MRHILRAWLLVALVSGCGAAPRAADTAEVAPAPATPRVVVAVVLDQLATRSLERYLPYLDEDGALRSAVARGAFHHDVVYPYAGTYTAAGHTAIHTGAPPALSGVVSNEISGFGRGRRRCRLSTTASTRCSAWKARSRAPR